MFISDYAGGFNNPYEKMKSVNNEHYKQMQSQTDVKEQNNIETFEPRETYGIMVLELMSDEEYSNFKRVTEFDNSSNTYEYARNIEQLASDYLKSNEIIEDETITKAVNTKNKDLEELKSEYDEIGGMQTIFDSELGKYIEKVKSMVGGNVQDLIRFMNNYSNSLKYSQIDLRA
jgi:hypothetical protein